MIYMWSAVAQLVEHSTGDQIVARSRRSHCVVSLSKTLYLLLSTGSRHEMIPT